MATTVSNKPRVGIKESAAETDKAAQKTAKRQRVFDRVSRGAFMVCAAFSVLAIVAITLYLVVAGIPGLAKTGFVKALFGLVWSPSNDAFGLFPMVVSTLYITAGAVVIGGFFGLFTAVFIARFCPKKLKGIIRQMMNLLAGLPSVIFGTFGMVVLVPFMRDVLISMGASDTTTGFGILPCSIVLGIMILPTVISLSVNAMDAQPQAYYEGALALGATKEQATFKVLLPASKSGVLAGLILGTGRAMGETMAVVMVCGGVANMPEGLFGSVRTLTANIVMEMGYADGLQREMLFSSALVLLVFVLLLTLSINLLRRKKR